MSKNPKECAVINSTKTLIFENMLAPYNAGGNANTSPMEFFHPSFSRFKVTIIEDGHAVSGNINSASIPGIAAKSDYAVHRCMEALYSNKNDEGAGLTSPAYTTKIISGIYKNRTPAEIILTDGKAGKDGLNKQYQWLKKNLRQHPNNQVQMDAIADAGRLYQSGELKPVAAAKPIEIYNSSMRPLVRKKNEDDGKCPVYEVKILCYPDDKYPFLVDIQNYQAVVAKTDKGLLNIQSGTKSDIIHCDMRLNVDQWSYVLYQLQLNMRTFETMHMSEVTKTAEKLSYQSVS